MRAPLTVIIPVLNAEQTLPKCLSALGAGLQAGLIRELILSDGGSSDASRTIAEAAGATWVTGPASRGGQMRRGAALAQGEWLLFLHADTVLAMGWAEVAHAHLVQDNGKAGYYRLRFDTAGLPARIVAGWANLRSRVFGLPYGDQGLLISRALYDEVGGFADQPLMEDVLMARMLRGRLRALNATATTSASKYQRQGWVRRGARNLLTLCRYFLGVSPARLARDYQRK